MRSPGLIILAAGGSRRMGRPKQLLPWNEGSLLRHAAITALATPCRPIVIVLGCEAEACQRDLSGLDVEVAFNPDWEAGMGRSVSVGIATLEKLRPDISGALLMLVDQPSLTASSLSFLLERWADSQQTLVATKYGELAGVPAIFDRQFFPQLRALNADRGARDLIASHRDLVSAVDLESDLIDLDTPALYQAQRREKVQPSLPPR
jgi:molybdenum cofactor cytidylyltransferase